MELILPLNATFVLETRESISNCTQGHFEEIKISPSASNEFLEEVLKKLSYFMSDRAANEKKADDLLCNLGEKMMSKCGEEIFGNVHSIHHARPSF